MAILLFIIFSALALLHFYWAVGGEWAFADALPTNEKGQRILNPTKMMSAVVGLGLAGFAFFYLVQTDFLNVEIPAWIFKYGGWVIPAIFLIRALGDFKYVGFFKKIKNTPFGKMDTKFYAPLCLVLGLLGLAVQIFN